MSTLLSGKFYTVNEAAESLSCTTSYLRQLLRSNRLLGQKIGERAWVLPASEVERLRKGPLTGKRGRQRSGKNS